MKEPEFPGFDALLVPTDAGPDSSSQEELGDARTQIRDQGPAAITLPDLESFTDTSDSDDIRTEARTVNSVHIIHHNSSPPTLSERTIDVLEEFPPGPVSRRDTIGNLNSEFYPTDRLQFCFEIGTSESFIEDIKESYTENTTMFDGREELVDSINSHVAEVSSLESGNELPRPPGSARGIALT